jgi:hypothetical protein
MRYQLEPNQSLFFLTRFRVMLRRTTHRVGFIDNVGRMVVTFITGEKHGYSPEFHQ